MKIFAAALIVLAFPATAWGEATLVTREVPLPGQRTLAAAVAAPERFNLVGLHWMGPGSAELRAQDVRLELLARGRGRGDRPPRQRLVGGAPDARVAARRAPVDR